MDKSNFTKSSGFVTHENTVNPENFTETNDQNEQPILSRNFMSSMKKSRISKVYKSKYNDKH